MLTTLHAFAGGEDGSNPESGLTLRNGTFYGTTDLGGGPLGGKGTLYALSPAGSGYAETVVHNFAGPPLDGLYPDSRRRERGVGDQATRAFSAQKCTIAGESPAHVARRGMRAHMTIIRSADVIGMERLNLRAMTRSAEGTVEAPGRNVAAKSGLNRVLLDAGCGILRRLIGEKAAWAAREVIDVEANYSTQTCGRCLHVCAKSRLRRRFVCVSCGFTTHADVNAALEFRRRAQLARTSALSWERTSLMSHDAA